MLPPFLQGGQNIPNFSPHFDPNCLWTAIFLNCGTLSEKTNLSRTDVRTVGAMDTQKGKSGKFPIYAPFQWPTPSRRPLILHQQCGPRGAHKISTDIRLMLPPFYQGECPKFWPKFLPQSPLDCHIFELQHYIGNEKQTCQGSVIDLSPHQTWYKSGPPTLTTVGAMGTLKG